MGSGWTPCSLVRLLFRTYRLVLQVQFVPVDLECAFRSQLLFSGAALGQFLCVHANVPKGSCPQLLQFPFSALPGEKDVTCHMCG